MANIDLPLVLLHECTFDLLEGVAASPFGRGQSFNLTQVSDPVWKAHIETIELDRPGRQIWSAWKKSLKGGFNRMRAYDVARARPLAYRSAANPAAVSAGWSGAGVAVTVNDSGLITASGMPPGYKASIGDRVGIEQSGRFGYYEILTDATASGGGALSLNVSPPPHAAYFSAGAVVRLWQPMALFIIDWKSWSLSETSDQTPASFDAYQVLK